jgi:hypothetical protein
VNVRDYNNDGNTNATNNTSTIQVWENGLGQRLDRQEYILPAAIARQTLASVTITYTGNAGNGTNGSRAVLAAGTVSTCGTYTAEGITVSSGPIVYDPGPRLYVQQLDVTNGGTTAIAGPLFLILENLPDGVSVVNRSTPSTCFAPIGSPTLVALPKDSSLAPNTSLNTTLVFRDPSGTAITYTPLAVY